MFLITLLSMLVISATAHEPVSKIQTHWSQFKLDKSRVVGTWHHISRTPAPFDPKSGKCTNICTYLNENGTITIGTADLNSATGYVDNWGGLHVPVGGKSTANFLYLLSPKADNPKLMFSVLDTDYTHYIVALIIDNYHKKSSWSSPYVRIGSRERTLAPEYYSRAIKVLRKNNIRSDNLEIVNQDDCDNW